MAPVESPTVSDQAVAAEPHPLIDQLSALHHFRIYADIAVVVVVLALTNLIAHFTTPWASIATVPAAAVGLLLLVRQAGRPGVEALPVLRGRDGRRPAALRAPPAPRWHVV